MRSVTTGHEQVVEPADHLQVLPAGQVLVHGGELACETDEAAHNLRLGDDVVAEHSGFSPSWEMIVARILTIVVFPAPFGPSSPNTVPASTSKLTPSTARTSLPNTFTSSWTSTAITESYSQSPHTCPSTYGVEPLEQVTMPNDVGSDRFFEVVRRQRAHRAFAPIPSETT